MLLEAGTVHLIKKVIGSSGTIDLPAEGESMFPFIKNGDICTFTITDPSQLKKGDVALFHSAATGKLVAHRFVHSTVIDEEQYYVFKGDTNLGFDKPVQKTQIIGKLVLVQKNKLKINVGNSCAVLYGKLLLALPVLSGLLRNYLNRRWV